MPAWTRRSSLWVLLGAVWLASVVLGLRLLMDYDNRPGAAAEPPAVWPADSRLVPDPAGPTLLMLAHPRCDCTRASLTELSELLARADRRPRTYVVFIRPGHVESGWEQTTLWSSAAAIPGVTVVRDEDGAESRRFGVHTSGQVLLYGAGGQLLYSGGATASRGKTGNSLGRTSILAALQSRNAQPPAPVFGCSLFEPVNEIADASSHAHR
jgi:hypothetical protein